MPVEQVSDLGRSLRLIRRNPNRPNFFEARITLSCSPDQQTTDRVAQANAVEEIDDLITSPYETPLKPRAAQYSVLNLADQLFERDASRLDACHIPLEEQVDQVVDQIVQFSPLVAGPFAEASLVQHAAVFLIH